MPRVLLVQMDLLVRRVELVRTDLPAPRVHRVQKATKVIKGLQVHKGPEEQAQLVHKVIKVTKARKAIKD